MTELVVGGMTCGACAARIERRLNRLDGVAATVNYATGRAYITSLGGREPGELIGVIESTGYTAELPPSPEDDAEPRPARETRELGVRLAVCAPLAVAVIVLAMTPALQFTGWQWVSLLLAAPVAVWGAGPLHRAAWYGLGHAAATLVGVRAAGRRGGHVRDADVVRVHVRRRDQPHPVPGSRRRGHDRGAGRPVPGSEG
jgi:Cu+-exporting ATPase